MTPERLRRLPAFTEGLENRWHRAFSTLPTYDEALFSVKTKRYAFSACAAWELTRCCSRHKISSTSLTAKASVRAHPGLQ